MNIKIKSSKWKNVIMSFALVICSLLVVLAIGEICLRIIDYNPLKGWQRSRRGVVGASPDNNLKYELIPGANIFAHGINYKINDHGYCG
ncbi:hypothetical protein KKC59_00100 [bacterium]|nr:hypothetical protein [bacterium]